MKYRHCDICGKVIDDKETYYHFTKHWWNGFQQHNYEKIDICKYCFVDIQKIKQGENNGKNKSRDT